MNSEAEGISLFNKKQQTEKTRTTISSAVQIAGVVLAWVVYSLWCRKVLSQTTFAAMQLLAETRQPDGDPVQAREVARQLTVVDAVPEGWHWMAGDPKAHGGPVYRAGDDCVVQFSADESTYGLHVPVRPHTGSLPDMVAQRPYVTHLEEDLTLRSRYMDHTTNYVAMNASNAPALDGSYGWCFRDYVNHEELFGMLSIRMCVEKVFFLPVKIGQITVDANTGSCALDDRSLLFGIVPLEMHWRGHLNSQEGAIVWDRTSLDIGWKGTVLSKHFDRPAMSERLRRDRWLVRYAKGHETTGDLVFMYREGRGTLVYSRTEGS